jgi:two-component system, OmpR family, sensor histidine kinase VicK
LLFRRNLEKTSILHRHDVINTLLHIFSNAQHTLDICGNAKFPLKIFSFDCVNKLRTDSSSKQTGLRRRYIFEITKENVIYCRDLMKMGDDLHHMDSIEANFVVNETEYLGSITFQEPHQAIYSNLGEVVEQQHSVFENLWNKSIPAENVIAEIEEGVEPEFLDVISDSQKATEIYVKLVNSLQHEGLLLFADSKAMFRADKLGIIDSLIKASQNGVTIKIICPLAEDNLEIVKRIYEKAPHIRILNGGSSHSGLFVADGTKFLRFELKEPRAEEFSEAVGFIIHSNSKASVNSSKSFFELIWNEHTQYEKIKQYERQKQADKLKDEFINVAAHELRTPIQPILGLSQVLRSRKLYATDDYDKYLDTIIRNAKRLQRLADSILDVTRIESQSLKLRKEKISIDDVIMDAIQDYRDEIEKCNSNLKLLYEPSNKENIIVEADRGRLTQVICNLLSNAVKFTKEGVISIRTVKRGENDKDILIVSVKDTGSGIDPEIFQKLFSRFVSKSFSGTGLGLFISKSIVEAHEGEIWAENNADGKGATFYFSLPLAGHQEQIR